MGNYDPSRGVGLVGGASSSGCGREMGDSSRYILGVVRGRSLQPFQSVGEGMDK